MTWILPGMLLALASDPASVVGGTEASECQWPTVVQLDTVVDTTSYECTGVLVAPDVVLTAGHCIFEGGLPLVRFGEDENAPVEAIPSTSCERHPEFFADPEGGTDFDLAVCRLLRPALSLPLVPVAAGCDADALVEDAMVTVVGFGLSDEADVTSNGIKRMTTMRIESVSEAEVVLRSADGSGTCYGDSGGPLLVAMADGTWRVAAIGSTAHPDNFACGYGAVYDRIDPELAWIERAAGVDLTPCHDADGTWNPSEACDAFPLAPEAAGATWVSSCAGGPSSELGSLCGPAFGEEGGSTSTTGGEESSSSESESSSGSGSSSSDSGELESSSSSESGTTQPVDETEPPPMHDEGCGCRSTAGSPVLVLFVLLLQRRRRRSTPSSTSASHP